MNAETRLRAAIKRLMKDGRSRNPKDNRPSKGDVAAAIDVLPSQFSRWLTGGGSPPQIADLDALASVLRCSIAELVDPSWHEASPVAAFTDEQRMIAERWATVDVRVRPLILPLLGLKATGEEPTLRPSRRASAASGLVRRRNRPEDDDDPVDE